MVVRKVCGLPRIDLEGHEGNYDVIVYNCLCLVTNIFSHVTFGKSTDTFTYFVVF